MSLGRVGVGGEFAGSSLVEIIFTFCFFCQPNLFQKKKYFVCKEKIKAKKRGMEGLQKNKSTLYTATQMLKEEIDKSLRNGRHTIAS
jgi:hypothetical protein